MGDICSVYQMAGTPNWARKAEGLQGRKWKWAAHYYAMHLVVLSESTDFTKLDFRACFSHLFLSTLPRKGLNKSPIQQLRAIGSQILNFLQFNFMVICLILIIFSGRLFHLLRKELAWRPITPEVSRINENSVSKDLKFSFTVFRVEHLKGKDELQ